MGHRNRLAALPTRYTASVVYLKYPAHSPSKLHGLQSRELGRREQGSSGAGIVASSANDSAEPRFARKDPLGERWGGILAGDRGASRGGSGDREALATPLSGRRARWYAHPRALGAPEDDHRCEGAVGGRGDHAGAEGRDPLEHAASGPPRWSQPTSRINT